MSKVYSDKQLALLQLWQQRHLKRINLLEGSVRSGKTWISLVLWAFWVATMPINGNYLMVAKTLTSLRRNCLDLLESLVGSKNFTYSLSKKEGRLFGRLIYLEGVNDARAESKIRGMTLQGAYCDELTLFTEDFFTMLLSRLSMANAKLIATTNPDAPLHWLMTKYIKRQSELDMLTIKFLLEDNFTLDATYVENLKKEYTGVFYKRFILGEWCNAEGLIYDMFDKEKHVAQLQITNKQGEKVPRKYTEYMLSCDYGTQNATVYGLWGCFEKVWYLIREYYYSGRDKQQQKTDEEYYQDLVKFVGDTPARSIIIDPSAASFIACIRRHGRFIAIQANNTVVDGIRFTGSLIQSGKLFICEGCEYTLQEIQGYCWDKGETEDKPVKEADHCMDMMRYFTYTHIRRNAYKYGIHMLGVKKE